MPVGYKREKFTNTLLKPIALPQQPLESTSSAHATWDTTPYARESKLSILTKVMEIEYIKYSILNEKTRLFKLFSSGNRNEENCFW